MSEDLGVMSNAQQVILFSQRLAPLIAANKKDIENLRRAEQGVFAAQLALSDYLSEVSRLRETFPSITDDDVRFLEENTQPTKAKKERAPSIEKDEKLRILREIWGSRRDSIETFADLKREFRLISNGGNLGSISSLCDSGLLSRNCFSPVPESKRRLGAPIVKGAMDKALANGKSEPAGRKTKT